MLRESLKVKLEKKNIGDYDGHKIEADLSDDFMYLNLLESTSFLKGGTVTLVLGEMGSDCKRLYYEI